MKYNPKNLKIAVPDQQTNWIIPAKQINSLTLNSLKTINAKILEDYNINAKLKHNRIMSGEMLSNCERGNLLLKSASVGEGGLE